MPEFLVEFEVYCNCGNGLCNQSNGGNNSKYPYVTVEPCEKCMGKEFDSGYEKGFQEAENMLP